MHPIVRRLQGGDLRSKGRSEEVAAEVLENPRLLQPLLRGMLDEDPVVRMRSADAVAKICAIRPEELQPYKELLINEIAKIGQQEVRWHVAEIFWYLTLDPEERRTVMEILTGYLTDKSRIVKTCAMQALAKIAEQDPELRVIIVPMIRELTASGSPATAMYQLRFGQFSSEPRKCSASTPL